MNASIKEHVGSAARKALNPRTLKGISRIAKLQGGSSTIENYLLLGKRAAIGVGAGVVVAYAGSRAIGSVRSHVARKLQEDRDEAETFEREWLREKGIEPVAEQTFYRRYGKRACDIVIGVVALPVVGAVTAASGIAIKCEDGGPIFYNAPRMGLNGREFTMFKLRSMKENAPDLVMEDGSTYNGADDPRMTQVGAFLRKTSLDEIPQFLNVLRGDMSVVGPRPDLKRETELYQGDEALKLTVKPGVTGYAAVYGRNSLPWHDRLALDLHYVRNLSFPLDVEVFLKTFAAVFKQEGIYVEEE